MIRIRNYIYIFFFISSLSSCIEPFSPNIGGQVDPKYVVDGLITDKEGYQTVSISMTSTIDKPEFNPMSNCTVKIIDNLGNTFNLDESDKGVYRVWMAKEYLVPGNAYQVKIVTESGVEIESDFDLMPECPDIDSIYYTRKDYPTNNPYKPKQGFQFYINYDGKDTKSRFVRLQITETWEHRATYPKDLYWNGSNIVKFFPPDYSKFYCWSTQKLNNIYTLSTENLSQNKFLKYQLHYVDNQTQRLTFCYSLLVEQFALSDASYRFWDKLRINSNDQGGLYSTQPLQIKGNLRSTTNPELEILGFFSASSLKTKRIFVKNVQGITLQYPECIVRPQGKGDLQPNLPQYLINLDGFIQIEHYKCVECDYAGGSTIKPDYWPN